MPEVHERTDAVSTEELLADFDRRKDSLDDLCRTTKSLVETILKEKGISIHSVQGRVKGRNKLATKYNSSDKDYRSLNEISDVVAFRIITYYADAIDNVKNTVLREFALIGQPDDKRVAAKVHEFGYSALHVDCTYSEARLSGTEYQRFTNTRFEIQITTILGHAWAEIHHGWYDNKSISPADEERRFHRLAAVLELADQEFVHIRKEKENREKVASVRKNLPTPGDITLQEPQELERQMLDPAS
jgi:putative GTP pyrophosphokinase